MRIKCKQSCIYFVMASGKENILLAALKECTTDISSRTEPDCGKAIFVDDEETELTIKVTNKPRQSRSKKTVSLYPFAPLQNDYKGYRGYPIDGTGSLKKGKWKIQIMSSDCPAPTEPLPQFPQQETLIRERNGQYVGVEPYSLSEKQVSFLA